jgi:signal transduction histidine kinase
MKISGSVLKREPFSGDTLSNKKARKHPVSKAFPSDYRQEAFHETENINKQLSSFTYVSSHDLQEPLRKIQTFSSRILEKEHQNLSEAGKEYFSRMQKAAKRMQMILDNLIIYSKVEAGERIFEKTDLNLVIGEVMSDLKVSLLEKNAVVKTIKLGNAKIIRSQFRQLLYHLFTNSLKFSGSGQQLLITVRSRTASGLRLGNSALLPHTRYCHLSFSDNGLGFEQRFSERIFEMFQKLHGKDEYEGTGIGLAICRKIVENHDGVITASGELNKGARFDIYIPVN